MDPVRESGPWIRSKVGVHGPLVHVLSSPKIRKRSTQISKTKHPKLENEAPKTRNHCRLNNYNFTSSMTQSESGVGSGCVRTSKGRQIHPKVWPVSSLGVFVFEFLGAWFSRFGCFVFDRCFVFEIWVLRASVFFFKCFIFETTVE